ncbi:MAG: dehydrogenase E1 component subunit alpha/beta [Steroidobacteraceae bacterium]
MPMRAIYRGYLVRVVEEELLKLFSAGKLAGTTHTCIGQEMSAVALADSLDRTRDLIFSNHRCHGHYVAWTDDVEGLLAEVMGKRTGVCAGIGGSQHLCGEGFFSNGIQGGIVPVSAGLALAKKMDGRQGIVAVCIGDGTLGEGVVYETFNIAVKWRLPLLIMLENNMYAQSTSQAETLAGDICARAGAFGMKTFHGDTWNHQALATTLHQAANYVRGQCAPAFVRVDTYRLAAHSKGDDDRDQEEIARYAHRDPVNMLLETESHAENSALAVIRRRVHVAIRRAEQEEQPHHELRRDKQTVQSQLTVREVDECDANTQLEAINRALQAWLRDDNTVILLGEDIRSPYGGAFKVTRGLSDLFPDRVFNTPISEAAIVGLGNGVSLGGRRAVVEIMFGDFLTLCFDQILNHAAKFHDMYNRRVTNPLVLRTPMGGGRGYGPTHSQSLEKHFLGIPGMTVLVFHQRTRVASVYETLRQFQHPLLIIENKLLYRTRGDAALPTGYRLFETSGKFPETWLRPAVEADLTMVVFGRMGVLAEKVVERLAIEEEIFVDLILPLQVSPFDPTLALESTSRTGKLLVVEEGAAEFDLGSEVIAAVSVAYRGRNRLHCRRIAALSTPIPSAPALEQHVLPGEMDIFDTCVELFDE